MNIRIVKIKDISKSYLDTINHKKTKRFIQYSKNQNKKISKTDLINYIRNLPDNEKLYGIFENNVHKANFKLTIKKKKFFIGFLVFLKYQGKGLIAKSFKRIIKLVSLKNTKNRKLYLGVDRSNKNAINLYIKLGFKKLKNSRKIMYLNY